MLKLPLVLWSIVVFAPSNAFSVPKNSHSRNASLESCSPKTDDVLKWTSSLSRSALGVKHPLFVPSEMEYPAPEEIHLAGGRPITTGRHVIAGPTSCDDMEEEAVQSLVCPKTFLLNFDKQRVPQSVIETVCLCPSARGNLNLACRTTSIELKTLYRAEECSDEFVRTIERFAIGCEAVFERTQNQVDEDVVEVVAGPEMES